MISKDTGRIDRSRLQRLFIGMHTPEEPLEKWYEAGHFIEGFELKYKQLSQKDGRLRLRTEGLGCSVEGTCEPAQNKIVDYIFYLTKMNGIRNVALLINTDELILFRLVKNIEGGWDDNRISIATSGGYGSTMQKAYTDFSGWVKYYEKFRVKDLKLQGTNLHYTILESLYAIGIKQKLENGGGA